MIQRPSIRMRPQQFSFQKLRVCWEWLASSLYTDQGADGNTPTEMGVYLDLGMGLASTLLPSTNTVTAPKAGQIVPVSLSDSPNYYVTVEHDSESGLQIYLNGPSGTIDSPLVDRFQFQLGSDTNYSSTQNDTSNPDQLVSMILGSNEFVLNSDISSAPTIQYFGLIGGGTSFINSSSSGNEFNGVDLLGFSGVNLPNNLGNGFGKLI